MDIDVFEQHGWEHLPDYGSNHSNSSFEGGSSQTTLSPSLQSYLNVNNNNNNNNPSSSWAGGGSAFSPYQQPNPTSIRHIDIARTVRRRGPSWTRNKLRGSSGNLYHGGTSLGPSTHATSGSYARSISDVKSAKNNPYCRRAVPLNAQYKNILERGWDGRMVLGRRTGAERRLLAAHLSTSASAPCFEERRQQYLAAPKSWDNPRMRANVRSAGPSRSRGSIILKDQTSFPGPDRSGRDADQTGDASSIRSGNGRTQSRRPRTAPGLQPPPRLSPSGEGGRTRALSRAVSGPDPGTMGMQHAGGQGYAGMSRSGVAEEHVPELSRSLSPSPQTNRHLPPFTSSSFGPSRHNTEESARRQARFVTVRALSLLPGGSIGQEVSAVGMSPFNSVGSLRAAIYTDIDRKTRPTIDAGGGSGGGGSSSPSPAFLFSYADGVPIDRGQEDRLSVQDIAIASSPSSRETNNVNPRGEKDGRGRSAEACVFVRACSYQSDELETGDGLHEGGVLSRWGSLQGGSCESEAFPLDDSAGGNQDLLLSTDQGSLSPPGKHASLYFHGGREHWSGDGRGSRTTLGAGGLNVWSTQRAQRRMSVSFDESKAARRQRILEQVERLAASKATTIAKVCRGHQARVLFRGRLNRHQKALTIQLSVRRWAAWLELKHRVRRRDGAVKIQALVRSHISQRETSLLREAALRRDREDAAQRIQCNARKMAARLEFQSRWQMRKAAVVLQCWARLKAAKEKAGLHAQRSASLSLATTADPTSVANVEKQEPSVAGEPVTNEPLTAEATTHTVVAPSAQGSVVEMEEGGAPVTDEPDANVVVLADETPVHEVAPSSQGPSVEMEQGGVSVEGRPDANVVVLADEATTHEVAPSSQRPHAEVEEGGALVADDVVLTAVGTDHEVAPSSQGFQPETLMAAAEEGEALEKGAASEKEVSAATMGPLDTVSLSTEEPHLDGGGGGVSEPERVTSECSEAVDKRAPLGVEEGAVAAVDKIASLRAEERAAVFDDESVNSETVTRTEGIPFTANEHAPPDKGGVVAGSPHAAGAVPVGDVPVVGENFVQEGGGGSDFAAPQEEPASVCDAALTESVRQDHDALSIGPSEQVSENNTDKTVVTQISAVAVGEAGARQLAVEEEDASILMDTEETYATATEENTPSAALDGEPAGDVAPLNIEPMRETSADQDCVNSGSLDDLTPSATDIVGVAKGIDDAQFTSEVKQDSTSTNANAKDVDDAAQITPAVEQDNTSASAKDEARMDEPTSEVVASGDAIPTVEESFVVPVSDDPPSSTTEAVGNAGETEVLQPVPVASQETPGTAIKDSSPTSAEDGASADGPTLEEVAPGYATTTAENPVVVPASDDSPKSAEEVVGHVQDAEQSQPTPAAAKDRAVAAITDNISTDALDGTSAEQLASGVAVPESISPVPVECATSPLSHGTTGPMGMVTDADVEFPTPEAGDEMLVAAIEDSSPNVIPGVASTDEPASNTLPQECKTPAAEESLAHPVWNDPTTSTKESPAAAYQRTSVNTEDSLAVAMEENAHAAVRDGEESAGEPAPTTIAPLRIIPAAEEPIARAISGDATSATGEASRSVEGTEIPQPTSVVSEEVLVAEIEDSADTNPSGPVTTDEPASTIPAPEDMTPGAKAPVTVTGTADLALVIGRIPRTVEDTGVEPLIPVAEGEILAAVNQVSASSATEGAMPKQSKSETAAPESSEMASDEKVDISVTVDPTSSATEALGMVRNIEIEPSSFSGAEEDLAGAEEEHACTVSPGEKIADKSAHISSPLEHVMSSAERSVDVPAVTSEPPLALTDTLGMSQEVGFEQPALVAGEDNIKATRQVNTTIDATDGVWAEHPALETTALEYSATAAEEKFASPDTDDLAVSATEGLGVAKDDDIEKPVPVGTEEVFEGDEEANTRAIASDQESADEPPYFDRPLVYAPPAAEESVSVEAMCDPPLVDADSLGMEKDADIEEHTPVAEVDVPSLVVGDSSTRGVLNQTPADEPGLIVPSPEGVACAVEGYVTVQGLEDPNSSTAEALRTEEAADLDNIAPVDGEETPVTPAEVIATSDAMDGAPSASESATTIATEEVAAPIVRDPKSSATDALGVATDDDGAIPNPVRAEEMLAGAGAIEVDPPAVLFDDASAAEPDHSPPALVDVAAVAKESVAVSGTDESTSSVKESPGANNETIIEQPTPGTTQKMLESAIAGNAPAIVPNLVPADEFSLEITAPERVTPVAEESVVASELNNPAPPTAEVPGMGGGDDVAQSTRAGAGEILAEVVEVGVTEVAVDGVSADEPTHTTPSLEDATSAATVPVTVSVPSDPLLTAEEIPEMGEDAGIEQSNLVVGQETLAATIRADDALTNTTDTTLVEEPALDIAMPEDCANTTGAQVAAPITDDLLLSASETLDKEESSDAGGFTPLAGEKLMSSENMCFTPNAADGTSTEQPALETSTPRHVTKLDEELVSVLVTGEPATPATEVLGMGEGAEIEQPSPVAEEHIAEEPITPTPTFVAATEENTLLIDPDSRLTEQSASATLAPGYAPLEAEEPVSDPVTGEFTPPEAATSGMKEDAHVEQSTPVTQGAMPLASTDENTTTSAIDGLLAEAQGSWDTAAVENTTMTPGERTDALTTSDPISSVTEVPGAVRDTDIEQPTPVSTEEILAGAIEEMTSTIVPGEEPADQPASVDAPSEWVPLVSEEDSAAPVIDGPTLAAKDNMGTVESPKVEQCTAVAEQEISGAAIEQSPPTVVLDRALGEGVSSTTSAPACVGPAELGTSSAEATSVATEVVGNPILSAMETSKVEENTGVEQPAPVAGESALVEAVEDSSASTDVPEEGLAENIAFGVAVPKHDSMAAEQRVAVPMTRGASFSVEEIRAMAEGVGVEKPPPAATAETVAELQDHDALHGVSTENTTSNFDSPEYGASVAAEDLVDGRETDECTMSAAEDVGQVTNNEVAQPTSVSSQEALAAATEDCVPIKVLGAASTGDNDSVSASPEHEALAEEEPIGDLDSLTSSARRVLEMVEDAEVTQPAPEAAKESLAATIEGVAPDVVLDAALAEEDASMTAAPEYVAPAAEDTVAVSVSDGPTSSAEVPGVSKDSEIEQPIVVAGEEELVAAIHASDMPGVRDGAITEDPAFTVDVHESGDPATEDSLVGRELGNIISSIGEPSNLTAEDVVEAPADEASVVIAEDTVAQKNVAEASESQRVEATTPEVVAEAPVMEEGAEVEKEHPVAGEQAPTTAVVGDSVHTAALDLPIPAEPSLGPAARIEEIPEIGEPVSVVLAVDGGAEVSADTSLEATMGNSEADKAIAGNTEVLSGEALFMKVAEESSAIVEGTEIKQLMFGTGDQTLVNPIEGIDSTVAVDETIAEGLSSTTSPDIDAGPTNEGLIASPVAGDLTFSVFEESSIAVVDAIEKSAESPPVSTTEDADVHQIVDGAVEDGTAEASIPGTTEEVQGSVEDTQTELPPLVAEEEVQALVLDGDPAEKPASMAHMGDEAAAGQPSVKTAAMVNDTPAAEEPFADQTVGDPVLWVDEASASTVDNSVIGSVEKEPVEAIGGVAAHEADTQATESKRDEASTPKDMDQLSEVADELDMKQPVPVGEEGVSETTTAEPGFVTATGGEATPVAKEPVVSAGLGGPTLPIDNSSAFRTDADGDVSVDKASEENVQEDEIQEAVSNSTQDTPTEVLATEQPALVADKDERGGETVENASDERAPAKELGSESPEIEENSPALEGPHTQLVPDVPISSVDAAFTLDVDASICMVKDLPTMAANEDIAVSQAAADSAESRFVEVVTPEVVEITPDISSTPAQEEAVLATEGLSTNAMVVNDAPGTADDSKSEIGYPVIGQETAVAAAEDIATLIQDGDIIGEPASVSDTLAEGAPTSLEPLANGFLAAAAAPVDNESGLVVAHDVDGSTNNDPKERIEGGENRQVSTDGSADRAMGVPDSEVATEAPEMTSDAEVENDSPMIGEEPPVDTIRDGIESANNDVSATIEENREGDAQHADVLLTESGLAGVLDLDADEESQKAGQAVWDNEVVTHATIVGEEAPPATSEESGPPATTDESGPITGSDKPVTDLERLAVGSDGAIADETTPLAKANETTTPPAEETLTRGVAPEDPTSLLDDGYLAAYDTVGEPVDKIEDERSVVVGEAGEVQQMIAEMPEGVQVDVLTPDVDDHELVLAKDTDPEQTIPAESMSSTAAGNANSEPCAEDFITDVVVSRGSVSLEDGIYVGAAVETAEVSEETPLTATIEGVEGRQTAAGAVEGVLADGLTPEVSASVNMAANTEIDTPTLVSGEEMPMARVGEGAPTAAVDRAVVEEPSHTATAEKEQEVQATETTAPTAALIGISTIQRPSLGAAEEQEAPKNEKPLADDVVSGDTPLSPGEASTPILAVDGAVEDTDPVSVAHGSVAEQPTSSASVQENTPIVSAAKGSLTDIVVSRSSTDFALGSADEASRDVPLEAAVNMEEIQEVPAEATGSGQEKALIPEAAEEASMADKADEVESAPVGEETFVSAFEDNAPTVTPGEETADNHASLNTQEEEEAAAPTANEHLTETDTGGPTMPDGEAPILAEDGAMGMIQDNALGTSIAGGTADKPKNESSSELNVGAPVHVESAEVGNHSVFALDEKPDPNHGEDDSPTIPDAENAEEANREAVGQQTTQEAEGASTEEVIETTTEQPAPMSSDGVFASNTEDMPISGEIDTGTAAEEAEGVSEATPQAGVGLGGPDSAVNEAPAFISNHVDDLAAEEVRANLAEDVVKVQREVAFPKGDEPVASIEETEPSPETREEEHVVEAAEREGGNAIDTAEEVSEPLGNTAERDAQPVEPGAETAVEGFQAADGNDLREEGARDEYATDGVLVDETVNVTVEQEGNVAAHEESRPANVLAGDLLDEALPSDSEPRASSSAQPIDGSDGQPAESTVGDDGKEYVVACAAEGAKTDTLTPDVVEGLGKVAADEPPPGTSGEEEKAPAPEENLVHHMHAELAPSADEEVSLAVVEPIEDSEGTATAAGLSLPEDNQTVAPGEILPEVDENDSNGTATASAAEEIDVQQLVRETGEGELVNLPTSEEERIEEVSDDAREETPMSAIKDSAPDTALGSEEAIVDVPPGTTATEAESARVVAEQNSTCATLDDTSRSLVEAAEAAVTLAEDEATKTSPDEVTAEMADEGELPQAIAIVEEDNPVVIIESGDTAAVGAEKEIAADGAESLFQSVDEATDGDAVGEERVPVSAATGTEHLSSFTVERTLADERVSAISSATGKRVSIDESSGVGEGHEVRVEESFADAAGLRSASTDEMVAADYAKDNPDHAPAGEAGIRSGEPTFAPVEEGLMAGGEEHPVVPPPLEEVQATDDTINGDKKTRLSEAALIDSAIEANVVNPTSGVLEGQGETDYVAVRKEATPPLGSEVCVPTKGGEPVDEAVEQTAKLSKEQAAEAVQPNFVAVEGPADEAPLAVNGAMKQEGFATRVEDSRPEDVDSEAEAPAMTTIADQSEPVATEDSAALEDRGNAAEAAKEMLEVPVAEPLHKTPEKAPASPQIAELAIGGGDTLAVEDEAPVGDEEGSAAIIAMGEAKVLTAASGRLPKPTPEPVEGGASDFSSLEEAVVPEPISLDADAGESMEDVRFVEFPAAEADKDVPLAADSETDHQEGEPAIGYESILVDENIDYVDNKMGAGVEKSVLVTTKDASTAVFEDGVHSNEVHHESVPSSTATLTSTAEGKNDKVIDETPPVASDVRDEADQLVVATVGDGLAAKDEEVSKYEEVSKDEKIASIFLESGAGEKEAALASDEELRESAVVVPDAAEVVYVEKPSSSEDIEGGTTAKVEEPAALSTSEQAQNYMASEGVASLAAQSAGITDIDESTPVSIDEKADVATAEPSQEQASTSTPDEQPPARTRNEAKPGVSSGTDVTLQDDADRKEITHTEEGGGHALPNAVMEEGNEGLPGDEAIGVLVD